MNQRTSTVRLALAVVLFLTGFAFLLSPLFYPWGVWAGPAFLGGFALMTFALSLSGLEDEA